MKIVLDASAALEIALNRKNAAALSRVANAAEAALAPDLYVAEVTNAVWKEHALAGYDLQASKSALESAMEFIDTLIPSEQLYKEAFELSLASRGSACDMFYIALALRENATLLTLDSKLRREAVRRGVRTG